MVTIKLGGAAANAMRGAPAKLAVGSKACGAGAAKMVNADVLRQGALRGVEAEGGRLGVAGKGAMAKGTNGAMAKGAMAKGAMMRGAEVEGARLVGMTKMAIGPAGAVKATKATAMTIPGKVVVTKAAATGASLWGSGLSLGLGLGAGALGPLLLVGAIGAIGVGIYVGVRHEKER